MHLNGSGTTLETAPLLPLGAPPRTVLFVGKSMSRTRCTGALMHAWRQNGVAVRWVNIAALRRRLGPERAVARLRQIKGRCRPDLVFVFLRDLPRELVREFRRTTPVVMWVEDALEGLEADHVDYMRGADLVSVSNPANIPALHARGVGPLLFQMSGFSPKYHYPARRRRERRDLAFIGGPGNQGQRGAFVGALSERFRTEVFGKQWQSEAARFPSLVVRRSVKPSGYRRVCGSSRVVLGLNEINDAAYYCSNRVWLSLGCGAFHMTHYVPGLEEVFRNHEHLVWFRDLDECVELVEHYLPRRAERQRIARAGHALALERHTYAHRVAAICERVCSDHEPELPPLLRGRGDPAVAATSAGPVPVRRAPKQSARRPSA
ncbi:MAG: glycosyltransferase [Planctomycetota bacterium]